MTKVFIHSWHGDFAKTCFVREMDYLGHAARSERPPLRLFACGCDRRHLQRVRRPSWMRLVLAFRLYQCLRCGANVFRLRTRQRRHYPIF